MAIPSRDDPRWPLYMAVRNMTALSGLIFSIGAIVCLPVVTRGKWWSSVIVAIILLTPGAALFLLTVKIYQRKRWAAFAAIALMTLLCLGLMFALTSVVRHVGIIDLFRGAQVGATVFVLFDCGLLVLTGKSLYRVSQSFAAMSLPELRDTGFEPVIPMPQAVLPVESHDAPPGAR